jgi:hypothetical protein
MPAYLMPSLSGRNDADASNRQEQHLNGSFPTCKESKTFFFLVVKQANSSQKVLTASAKHQVLSAPTNNGDKINLLMRTIAACWCILDLLSLTCAITVELGNSK